jgi:hypothetical protein
MPRAIISPMTKRSILRDLDRGVSRKALLSQYGLKNYSNISRIIQQRAVLDCIDRSMNKFSPLPSESINSMEPEYEKSPQKSNAGAAANTDQLLMVRAAKLKLRSRIMENVFSELRDQLHVHSTRMKELYGAIEEVADENVEEMESIDEDEQEDGEQEGEQHGKGIVDNKAVLRAYCDYMTSLNIVNNTVETMEEGVVCLYKEAVRMGKLLSQEECLAESAAEMDSTVDTDDDGDGVEEEETEEEENEDDN